MSLKDLEWIGIRTEDANRLLRSHKEMERMKQMKQIEEDKMKKDLKMKDTLKNHLTLMESLDLFDILYNNNILGDKLLHLNADTLRTIGVKFKRSQKFLEKLSNLRPILEGT